MVGQLYVVLLTLINDFYLYHHHSQYTIWFDLCCSYSFGTVGGVIKPDLILPYIISYYLTPSYLTLYHIILSCSILSELILSYIILSYLSLTCLTILYYAILYYDICVLICDLTHSAVD